MSVHIRCQASIYTLSLCRGHSWRVRLAKQETLTPPGHLVSPLVCRGPWISTVVLYCWCRSDSASVLLYFTLSLKWSASLCPRSWFGFGYVELHIPEMENAENSLKIDVIRPVNFSFIQDEMTLWWIIDETSRKNGNNTKRGSLIDDHGLRVTVVKVWRREIWYRSTERVKSPHVMTHVAQISKTFMYQNCSQFCPRSQSCNFK